MGIKRFLFTSFLSLGIANSCCFSMENVNNKKILESDKFWNANIFTNENLEKFKNHQVDCEETIYSDEELKNEFVYRVFNLVNCRLICFERNYSNQKYLLRISSVDVCPFCNDEVLMTNENNVLLNKHVVLECGHKVHLNCLAKSKEKKDYFNGNEICYKECPICNVPVNSVFFTVPKGLAVNSFKLFMPLLRSVIKEGQIRGLNLSDLKL